MAPESPPPRNRPRNRRIPRIECGNVTLLNDVEILFVLRDKLLQSCDDSRGFRSLVFSRLHSECDIFAASVVLSPTNTGASGIVNPRAASAVRTRGSLRISGFGFAEDPARQAGSTKKAKILPGRQDLRRGRPIPRDPSATSRATLRFSSWSDARRIGRLDELPSENRPALQSRC